MIHVGDSLRLGKKFFPNNIHVYSDVCGTAHVTIYFRRECTCKLRWGHLTDPGQIGAADFEFELKAHAIVYGQQVLVWPISTYDTRGPYQMIQSILKPGFFCQFDGVVMLVCCLDDYIMYISRSDDFRADNDDDRHMNRSLYLLCMASGVTIGTI